MPLVEENYWEYLLAALTGPLQGFLNAMVILYRDSKAVRKQLQRLLGIDYVKQRWSAASAYRTPQSSQQHSEQVAV